MLRERDSRGGATGEGALRLGGRRLRADETLVARAQLVERVLESAVGHVAALAHRQATLADRLAVPPGAAQARLAVAAAVAPRTCRRHQKKKQNNNTET